MGSILVGILESGGLDLGIIDGIIYGNKLGPGLPLGANDGIVLGIFDGILDYEVLGSSDGFELGIIDSIMDSNEVET